MAKVKNENWDLIEARRELDEDEEYQANKKAADEIKFPATQTVHCPSGPTNACDKHAYELKGLMSVMGAHVVSAKLTAATECDNCVNENKNSQ